MAPRRAEGSRVLAGDHAGEGVVDHRVLHARQVDREQQLLAVDVRRAVQVARLPHGEVAGGAAGPLEVDAVVAVVRVVEQGEAGAAACARC